MILYNPKTKADFEIHFKKYSGEEQSTCPMCSETRKKKTDKCFSYNHDKKVGRCNHCGEALILKPEHVKEYKRPPEWKNKTELSDKVVKWFLSRGIHQETVKHFKISEGPEFMPQVGKEINTIQFPYIRGGDVVNVKYRGPKKEFKMYKDAELTLFNIDSLNGFSECVFVEGELDSMAVHQAGIVPVVSVPNGGVVNGKCNLDYLDGCIEYFMDMKKIYLATDDDATGRNLQEQLAERLGKERCLRVKFKESKDANECLMKFGDGGIIEGLSAAEPYPLEGITTVFDYSDELQDIYDNGLPKGAKTMMNGLNELIEFHKGYFTVITGIPNHGKTSYLDQICLQLSIVNGWKGAYYSPENKPTSLHISNLSRKLIGKPWWGDGRITKAEIEVAKEFLGERFSFITPERDFSLDSILKYVVRLKQTKGIDFFVIDAWNKLEHKHSGDENQYIGRCLDEIAMFCSHHNLHLFLVAHPRKMMKQKDSENYVVPNAYDINGSAHFFNKPDVNITVFRDYENDCTDVHVSKVKFDHWGKHGVVQFKYDPLSSRFTPYNGGAIINHDKSSWIGIRRADEQNQAPF